MASNFKQSDAAVNAAVNAIVDLADSGIIRIYNGAQPSTADTAVGAQTVLAELVMGSPAFGSASGGSAVAEAITSDSSANASGNASWFRVLTSSTETLWDGNVSTADADMIVNSTVFQSGASVALSDFAYTFPKSA